MTFAAFCSPLGEVIGFKQRAMTGLLDLGFEKQWLLCGESMFSG